MAIWDRFFNRNSVHDGEMIVEEASEIESRIIEIDDSRGFNEIDEGFDRVGINGHIASIEEEVNTRSPGSVAKLLQANEIRSAQILDELRADFGDDQVFQENEEMSRDSVVGSAMELMADDIVQINETTKTVVNIKSTNTDLQTLLKEFLEKNVNIEERIWEWTLEVIKHGDFKLRRCVFTKNGTADPRSAKSVYYENVLQPYKVSRIEYMGRVLGYMDEDIEDEERRTIFEKPETFVHFLNTKLPKRKRVKVQIRDENELNQIYCVKVRGVSIMDNARYIFRIVNLLDNMLIMSRVARSTQYNLVKVEVGGAGPTKTQEILSQVRRTIEGSTRIGKGRGMRTDPSPIPVNSNVYIPTRDGKGDVTVDSINESVDVNSIVDIDHFRNKEFATIKVPKQYLGFEEELPGSMGNNSLVKLDIRYARPVQKVQNIMRNGIEELCNNYLMFRGMKDQIGQFDVELRPINTSENSAKIEEYATNLQLFESTSNIMSSYESFIDKPRMFNTMLNLVGWNASDVGNDKFLGLVEKMMKGSYKSEDGEIASSGAEDEMNF